MKQTNNEVKDRKRLKKYLKKSNYSYKIKSK